MKLPEYAYRVSPEAQIQNPGIPALPGAPPTGAGELAAATSSLARSLAEAEDRVEASRRAVQLAQATTDLETFTADRVQKTDSSVSAAEADKQYRTEATQFIQQRVENIPDERQRNLATAHLMARADAGSVQVRHQANTRIIEDTRAAALPQIEALTRSGRPEDLQTALEFIAGLTDGGIFSAVAGNKLATKASKGAAQNRFALDVKIDPQAAFDAVGTRRGIYAHLDDHEASVLQAHAQTVITQNETRAREAIRWKQHQEDYQSRAAKEAKQAIVDATESQLLAGKLSLAQLESMREARLVVGDDYRRMRNELLTPSGMPSDPATHARVLLDSQSITPRTKPADIDALQGAGLLNLRDAATMKANLRERAQYLTTEGKSDIRYRQGQAEQQLAQAFTLQSPLGNLFNVEFQQIRSAALDELTKRSRAFDGEEDPMVAYNDIRGKYLPLAGAAASTRLRIERAALGKFKTKEALAAGYAGKAFDAEYYRIGARLRDLDAVEQEIAQMQGAGAAKPTVPGAAQPTKPAGKDKFGR